MTSTQDASSFSNPDQIRVKTSHLISHTPTIPVTDTEATKIPEYGFKVKFDHTYPENRTQYIKPTWQQIWSLIPLAIRYLWYYFKLHFFHGRKVVMDIIHPTIAQQIYGVPIGGVGGGTIGRGFRGEFCRYQLRPGMYRHDTVFANQFIVTIRNSDGITIFQSLLSRYPKPRNILQSWKSELDPSRCNYTGLYPRAWSEYDLSKYGVKLVCRQISPVIPNNYKDSSFPGAVFIWTAENTTNEMRSVTITFTFKNGAGNEHSGSDETMSTGFITNEANGILISGKYEGATSTIFLASSEMDPHRVSKKLYFNPVGNGEEVWYELNTMGHLTPISSETSMNVNFDSKTGVYRHKLKDIGVALAHRIHLHPKSKQQLEFCLGWHIPLVRFSRVSKTVHEKYYMNHFDKGSKIETAMFMASYALSNWKQWENEIYAWQKPILQDPKLPPWYKSAIFNESYYISDGGSIWLKLAPEELKRLDSHDPRKEYGRFAYLESHEYRMYNTYDVHFYASFALAKLFPKIQLLIQYEIADAVSLEILTHRRGLYDGKKEQRKYKNSVVHDLGDPDEDPFHLVDAYPVHNVSEWRDLNPKFVLCVYRDYTNQVGDDNYLRDMYPVCRTVVEKSIHWDTDGDGIIENGGFPDQTFDVWVMTGPSAYCGGLWLAALYSMCEMAKKLNRHEDYERYSEMLKIGAENFEKKLWNGHSYTFDVHTDEKMVMADQLCGHWYLRCCGANDSHIFPPEHVKTALRTIFKNNVMQFKMGEMGAVNGFVRDAGVEMESIQTLESWTGVTYGLASLMIHEDMIFESFKTAGGMFTSMHDKLGLAYQTPEALYAENYYRAVGYMRPLSIWSMQLAWEQRQRRSSNS